MAGAGCGGSRDSTASTSDAAEALCEATLVEPVEALAADGVDELSGLVAGTGPSVSWWAHEDGGSEPELVGLDDRGRLVSRVAVTGAEAFDWEDIGRGPGPGPSSHLYLADTGDNESSRDTVAVARVPEPSAAPDQGASVAAEEARLRLPDGPRDIEALLVDPESGEVTLIHKRVLGPAEVYSAVPAFGDEVDAVEVGVVDLAGLTTPSDEPAVPSLVALARGAATGGDVTADGQVILMRTYGSLLVWRRGEGQSIGEAIVHNQPCEADTVPEQQGEAVAVKPDGTGYVTIGEGSEPPVHRFVAGPP